MPHFMMVLIPYINKPLLDNKMLTFEEYGAFKVYHAMGKFSRLQTDDIFSYFFLKIGSDTLCRLSPQETICMKCQILFSKHFKMPSAEIFTQDAKC